MLNTITDFAGLVTSFAYAVSPADPAGWVMTKMIRPKINTASAAPETDFTDDGNGRLSTVTDPAGRLTTLTYDVAGKLGRIARPGDISIVPALHTYRQSVPTEEAGLAMGGTGSSNSPAIPVLSTDVSALSAIYADFAGTPSTTLYGWIKTKTDPVYGYVVSQSLPYSNYDDLTDFTQKGLTVNYTRNDDGQVTRKDEVDADGTLLRSTLYGYDASTGPNHGDLTSTTLPDNTIECWTYSSNTDRPTVDAVSYPSPGGPIVRTTTSTYDGQGNLTGVVDPLSRTINYHPDIRGRLTRIDGLADNGGHPIATSYQYNTSNGLISQITWPDGGTSSFSYDSADNLTSTIDEQGRTTTYTY